MISVQGVGGNPFLLLSILVMYWTPEGEGVGGGGVSRSSVASFYAIGVGGGGQDLQNVPTEEKKIMYM